MLNINFARRAGFYRQQHALVRRPCCVVREAQCSAFAGKVIDAVRVVRIVLRL